MVKEYDEITGKSIVTTFVTHSAMQSSVSICVSVCLSVCPLTYLKATHPNFSKFSVFVTLGQGSVLL